MRSLLLSVSLLCTIFTTAVGAQPSQEAKTHYDAGTQYYLRGKYADAIREFQEAYRLTQAPALLYNISQAYERTPDVKQAREYLQRYLDSGAATPEEKSKLEDKIKAFDERIAAENAAATQPASQPVTPRDRPFKTWKWIALGTGGAFLATSIIFAIDAKNQQSKIEDAADGSNTWNLQGAWDRGERDKTIAWVTGAVGVAAIATGVTFLWLDRKGDEPVVSPTVSGNSVGASVSIRW